MSDFAKFKKSSDGLDRLTKELEKMNAPLADTKKEADPRYWKPSLDKSGNGAATIRFLPGAAADGDDALPWVRIWTHGFKGPTGKWYIENSLTTLKQKDPVSELNSKLWNAGGENSPQRKQARLQKRRLSYISNIYVVSDSKNPENEGKVFLFRYGKKIFDKITSQMKPEFEGDSPVNVFSLWKGANFKLRVRTVDNWPNYEQSVFESPSALSSDDDELEQIWKSEYSLKEFVNPSEFKSYEELKVRLDEVLCIGPDSAYEMRTPESSVPTKSVPVVETVIDDEDEDDDDLAAFKALAEK
jgi:hypothetical protein